MVRSVNSNRNNENNIVNLNETQEDVAIKTEDVTDDVLGNIDDELQEANAGASMAVDTDNISNKADNTYNTHKAGTDEEVMAEAMKNYCWITFVHSKTLKENGLVHIIVEYNLTKHWPRKLVALIKCKILHCLSHNFF